MHAYYSVHGRVGETTEIPSSFRRPKRLWVNQTPSTAVMFRPLNVSLESPLRPVTGLCHRYVYVSCVAHVILLRVAVRTATVRHPAMTTTCG